MADQIPTTRWQSIETAPRDGRVIKMRQGRWAPFHARWVNGQWQPIEYNHGLPATHWEAESDVGQS